jgi:uncharacterized protein YndB with AHSA1/START domain
VILDVVVDEVIPRPLDEVWRALTTAESISEWLMATEDFRPEVGARFRMKTGRLSEDGWVRAEVLELDPPRRMVWSWHVSFTPTSTTVTFELEPHVDGTRLRLTHTGEIDPLPGRELRDGWPGRIELLRRSLD